MEKYKAHKEFVTITARLNDIASITDYNLYEPHHIHGAEMHKNHRGSISSEKTSIEIEQVKEFVLTEVFP